MPEFLLPGVHPGVRRQGKGVPGHFQFRAAAAQARKMDSSVFSPPKALCHC